MPPAPRPPPASPALASTAPALTVNVDTSNFAPGGFVRVDIACTVSLAQISQLALPGDKTITAQAIEVIDRYRGISGGFGNSEAPTGSNRSVGAPV